MRRLLRAVLGRIRRWTTGQFVIFNLACLGMVGWLGLQRHSLMGALANLTIPNPIFDPELAKRLLAQGVARDAVQQMIDSQAHSFADAINQSWDLQSDITNQEYFMIAIVAIVIAVDWIWFGQSHVGGNRSDASVASDDTEPSSR